MKKTLLLASATACIFAFNAKAVEFKPYVGLDYAYTGAELSKEYDSPILENKFHSLNVNIGTRLDKNFGIEAFYQQSAEEEGTFNIAKTSFNAYGVDLAGYVPLNETTEAFATVGLGRYEVEAKVIGLKLSEKDTGVRFGLGLLHNINDNWALRGQIRYVNLDMESVDYMAEVSAGIRYNF